MRTNESSMFPDRNETDGLEVSQRSLILCLTDFNFDSKTSFRMNLQTSKFKKIAFQNYSKIIQILNQSDSLISSLAHLSRRKPNLKKSFKVIQVIITWDSSFQTRKRMSRSLKRAIFKFSESLDIELCKCLIVIDYKSNFHLYMDHINNNMLF